MPRAFDRNPIALDRNPLTGLVPEPGKLPKLNPIDFVESVVQIIIDNIERIPLIGPVVSGLSELLGLADGGALIDLLQGLVTLDPRTFLDGLSGMFGGGAGLGLPAVLSGLSTMFGGLRGDGFFDASKLFGALPTGIMNTIRGLFSFLGGNVELGQLIRATPGLEKNWLPPFDTAESIKADEWWSWNGTVGRTKPGSAECILDGAEHVQTSDPIDVVPDQQLSLGGYLRWANFTGTGAPAFILRVLAFDAGDQLIGSQQIGAVTPSVATSTNFETMMAASWTAPANAAYVRVRMECTAAATGGTVNWDDLWLRKPAQNLPQEWINGLVSKLSNLTAGIADAWNFAQNIIDTIMNGFGQFGSGFTLTHLLTQLGNIPQNAIAGLGGVLGGLLPKTDWTSFLNGFKAAGNNGTAPSTGSSLLDEVINSFLGVRTTAHTAQTTATNAAVSALPLMQTEEGEWKLTKQQWTPGTYTWNVDKTPSAGYEIVGYDLISVAGGDSGGTAGLRTEGARGGLGGGYRRKRIPIADMPNTVTVVVGSGGAAKSGAGRGNAGSPTRFTGLCESPLAGKTVIDTLFGDVPCADGPGRGGDSGGVIQTTDSGGSTTYTATNGQDGENSLEGQGGALGTSGSGWFGGSPTAPTAGGSPTQPGDDIRCGAGGGGAGGRTGAAGGMAGAAGGDPGGGGGAAGSWANNLYGGASSGPGGPGRAAAIKVERKLP